MRAHLHRSIVMFLLAASSLPGAQPLWAAPASKKGASSSSSGLSSSSFEQRVAAIDALAAGHDPRAVDLIIPMLKDRDATVRWAAANALETLHDARALPALELAATDQSPLVANRARDAVRALRPTGADAGTRVVRLIVHDVSGAHISGADVALLADAKQAVLAQKGFTVSDDTTASHVITLTMLPIKEKVVGAETQLEVNFTATVTQLPGNQLRFATRVGAGVAGSVPLGQAERAELVMDAVHSAAAALGEETVGYLAGH